MIDEMLGGEGLCINLVYEASFLMFILIKKIKEKVQRTGAANKVGRCLELRCVPKICFKI